MYCTTILNMGSLNVVHGNFLRTVFFSAVPCRIWETKTPCDSILLSAVSHLRNWVYVTLILCYFCIKVIPLSLEVQSFLTRAILINFTCTFVYLIVCNQFFWNRFSPTLLGSLCHLVCLYRQQRNLCISIKILS